MNPGDVFAWAGNELFTRPRVGINGVFRCPSGGHALVIALDSYRAQDDDDGEVVWYVQDMALVLVNDQLGWTPTNWLRQLE